jgi:hypothetical protein
MIARMQQQTKYGWYSHYWRGDQLLVIFDDAVRRCSIGGHRGGLRSSTASSKGFLEANSTSRPTSDGRTSPCAMSICCSSASVTKRHPRRAAHSGPFALCATAGRDRRRTDPRARKTRLKEGCIPNTQGLRDRSWLGVRLRERPRPRSPTSLQSQDRRSPPIRMRSASAAAPVDGARSGIVRFV